ncbi:MAG: N-acetylmuramoyl-L-alanine amidase [Desulfosalsimonadaceae bacterium]
MTKRAIFPAILLCAILVMCSCATTGASSPSQRYFEAEACYNSLKDDAGKKQYRSYWLDCIRQFEDVYRMDRKGPWAAAGLYMTGRLYGELYRLSYKPSDLTKARSLLEQVKSDYPRSDYSKRAAADLKDMGKGRQSRDTDEKAKRQYLAAESMYAALKRSPEKQKYRSYWLETIREYENVTRIDPEGPWAAAGLFRTGEMYRELYSHSYSPADEKKAEEIFREVIRRYPDSAYSKRAEVSIKSGSSRDDPIAALTGRETTSGEVVASTDKKAGNPTFGDPATITGIRYWSNPDYTRIVIDANQETDYINNFLKKDPSINQNHERLYVDLEKSRLSESIERRIPIDDAHLKDVRAGQFTPDTVRVVVDMKSFKDYNVFALKNPFRIVIDVRGESDSQGVPRPSTGRFHTGEIDQDTGAASIARQLALGVRRIVIDPGHGGKDPGAPGAVAGIYEKDVVLDISLMLAKKIKRDLGLEVVLTRTTDTYLTLEERTAIANTQRADLFISIHANASRNKNAHGMETYFLNLTTDNESIAVAARENATSEKNISELQEILNDLMHNAKINESSRLATYAQKSMYGKASGSFNPVVNKGVKQAPFYVLLGAQMPSILIETGFISNPRECRRLMDVDYQRVLCNGIVEGIRSFINDTRPPAMVATE